LLAPGRAPSPSFSPPLKVPSVEPRPSCSHHRKQAGGHLVRPWVMTVLGFRRAAVSGVVAGPWRPYHPGAPTCFRMRDRMCPLVGLAVFRSLNFNANTRWPFRRRRPGLIFRHLCGPSAGQRPWPFRCPVVDSDASFPEVRQYFRRNPQLPLAITKVLLTSCLVWNWRQNYGQRELTTLKQLAQKLEPLTKPKLPTTGAAQLAWLWPACWP